MTAGQELRGHLVPAGDCSGQAASRDCWDSWSRRGSSFKHQGADSTAQPAFRLRRQQQQQQ